MDFLDVIKNRHSVRSYDPDRPVPPSLIHEILDCGHRAPTGGNLQPWEFIVVTDRELRQQIMKLTYRGNSCDIHNNQTWVADAPVIIVVLGDKVKAAGRYGQKQAEALVQLDCSACVENMLLAAVNLGLGACYLSGFMEKPLANLLKVPSSHEIVSFMTLGYIRGEIVYKPKESLEGKIHYQQFGGGKT